MSKVIQLQSGDDITKAVGYLWECESEEVFFNIAPSSSFLQNAIALKLLMRETNRLGKNVVFIVKDPRDRQAAQRAGFETRAVLPPDVEVAANKTAAAKATFAKTMAAEAVAKELPDTLEEVSAQKYESMIANEVELKRQSKSALPKKIFSDINPRLEAIVEAQAIESESEKTFAGLSEENQADADQIKIDGDKDSFQNIINAAERNLETVWPYEPIVERVGSGDNFGKSIGDKIFSFKFLSVFIGAGLLMGALALFLILPKVEISIRPKTDMLISELKVVADKGIVKVDEAVNKIPAQTLRLEKQATKEFLATGQKDLNEKAKGVITIYNEFSSQAQTLVATTRFVSKDNIIFRLTKTVVVPGVKVENGQTVPGSIDADVAADQAGEKGNIAAGRFTIPGFAGSPKFEKFYGIATRAMAGGAEGKSTVVAQADFDNAKKELWNQLQTDLVRDIQDQIPAGLKLLGGAMKQDIIQTVSSAAVGEKADKFTLTIKGSAAALLFDENDLSALASLSAALAQKGGGAQDAVDKKATEEREISYDSLQADFTKGQISFKAKISQKLVWVIDAVKIKNLIIGRSAEEIKNIFAQHQEIDKAIVSFWPFWVNRAPNDFNKIKVAEQ